jgi:hypothetical protein
VAVVTVSSSNSTGSDQAASTSVTLSLNHTSDANGDVTAKKKLKGGLALVYDPEGDDGDDMCMEEKRASLPRYQKLLRLSTKI